GRPGRDLLESCLARRGALPPPGGDGRSGFLLPS
ncbi:MAG: hypothetical protein AVDCRST_MAG06-1819, partial [uncultured Nocardioides sp.]